MPSTSAASKTRMELCDEIAPDVNAETYPTNSELMFSLRAPFDSNLNKVANNSTSTAAAVLSRRTLFDIYVLVFEESEIKGKIISLAQENNHWSKCFAFPNTCLLFSHNCLPFQTNVLFFKTIALLFQTIISSFQTIVFLFQTIICFLQTIVSPSKHLFCFSKQLFAFSKQALLFHKY